MPPSLQLPSLSKDTINPHVKEADYAVRGNLSLRAETYRQQIAQLSAIQNPIELPFNEVVFANIGNPQQLDQKPITFIRQVLSLIEYPQLLQGPEDLLAQFGYKRDAIIRAKILLKEIRSIGAYSESQGVAYIRQKVADFIKGGLRKQSLRHSHYI
jgi:alanine transaminase